MKHRGVVWVALTAAVLLLSGCLFSARPRWQTTWNDPWRDGWLDPGQPVVAQAPPPAINTHLGAIGPQGNGQQVWIDGHYDLQQGDYRWIDGHWVQPPQPDWAWQQPAWNGGRWHRGYWHPGNQQIAPAYVQGNGAFNPGWGQGQGQGLVAQPIGGSVSVGGTGSITGPVAVPVR
ncbi:MAG: hypothetical protein Q8Q09_26615 [Deltaproteobacteria bacterium]|nr:hypothetical protein [Deltaproteobacteria bacterium]